MAIRGDDTGGTGTLSALGERVEGVRGDVGEIKEMLIEHVRESRIRDERITEKLIIVTHSAESAHKRIDDLARFRDDVIRFLPLLKVQSWLVAGLSIPVVIYLATLLYNQLMHVTP